MNIFLNSTGKQENTNCISKAVSLGDFVYVSAQTGSGETIEEQTMTACNKVIDAISSLGLKMHHLVKFTVYLKDIELKDAFLKTFEYFLEEPFPACSIVEVQGLEDHALVSIEALGVNTLRYEQRNTESSCSNGCKECSGHCHD